MLKGARLLLYNKHINYKSGNFLIKNFPSNIFTLVTISLFFKIILDLLGKKGYQLLQDLGRSQAISIINLLYSNKMPFNSQNIKELYNILDLFGYGEIRIHNVSKEKTEVTFIIRNSSIHRMQHIIPNYKGNPFVEGICIGIAENIFKQDMHSLETGFIQHKNKSIVVIRKSNEKRDLLIPIDILQDDYSNSLPFLNKSMIIKIFGHNMISWKKGSFRLVGCSAFVLPTAIFAALIKNLEKYPEHNFNYILYHLARVQSKESVNYEIRAHGYEKNIKLLRTILQHSDMTGFGTVKIHRYSEKLRKITARHYHNPVPYYFRKLYGPQKSSIDYYSSGLLAGLAESYFDEEIESKESKCVVNDKEYCYHIAKVGLSKCKINESIMDQIHEVLVPRNFTS